MCEENQPLHFSLSQQKFATYKFCRVNRGDNVEIP